MCILLLCSAATAAQNGNFVAQTPRAHVPAAPALPNAHGYPRQSGGSGYLLAAARMPAQAETEITRYARDDKHSVATLQGVVTKSPGGEPVKKAIIELIAESQNQGGNYTAQTGVDGSFRIEGILPGRYHLFVERPGYLDAGPHPTRPEGRLLTLTAGQEVKDLVIRLQAAALVAGRVTDEDGEPMANAQATVFRKTFIAGHTRWEQAGGERTNDLGDYRIANLSPGSYYVSITPPPDFETLIEVSSKAPVSEPHAAGATDKPKTSYQTTYYPGTRDRSQAEPIQLHAGDDFPANFSLTPAPALSVRGSVINLPPGASPVITLRSRDSNVGVSLAEMRQDGSFEIPGVSPGPYTIVAAVENATAPLMARQSLQVISDNVEGVRLAPQPGAWVRGRLRIDGKPAAAKIDPAQIFVALRSVDNDDATSSYALVAEFSPLAHVEADGRFEWKNVPAGSYFVELSSEANSGVNAKHFLKAVSAGIHGSDADLTVNGGAVDVEVIVSANGAVVDGRVTAHDGKASSNAIVVAVPEPRLRRRLDRFEKSLSDQNGSFTLRGLAPGDYTVYAWDGVDGEAYYNPEFLKSYEGQGSALHVSEGERKSLQLEVIPAPDDPATDSSQP